MSFDIYVNSYGSFAIPDPLTLDYNVEPNQQARVDIMDPSAPVDGVGAGLLENIFVTSPGDPAESGYTTITADLGAYAGQTIRLRFVEVDNQNSFYFGVDNVQVTGGGEIPALQDWGKALMIACLLIGGVVALRRRFTVRPF